MVSTLASLLRCATISPGTQPLLGFQPGGGPAKSRSSWRPGSRHGHKHRSRVILNHVLAVKAHVRGGRIIVDEPTDLPEGAALDLVVVGNDDLDEPDEVALMASLDRALDDEDGGRLVDVEEILAEVREQT